jgi:hypothetical protein
MNAKSNRSVTKRPIKQRRRSFVPPNRECKARTGTIRMNDSTTPSDKLSQPVTRYR